VLVVDTPWSLQLLMCVCELIFIGPVALPGDQNYTLMSHAALSSCAIVASASVAAHVQLAQELNNAAVNAAEDAAHAVRTAGEFSRILFQQWPHMKFLCLTTEFWSLVYFITSLFWSSVEQIAHCFNIRDLFASCRRVQQILMQAQYMYVPLCMLQHYVRDRANKCCQWCICIAEMHGFKSNARAV
jgi:hypothetical protein